jgi:hypothetical protein
MEEQFEIEIANKEIERLDRLMPLINALDSEDESHKNLAKMKLQVLIPPERFDAVMRILELKSQQQQTGVVVVPVLKEKNLPEGLDDTLKQK